MFAANTSTRTDHASTRPATADVRRALLMEQHLRATQQGPAPGRFATAARTAVAVLVLGAVIALLAVVGLALFIFTLGIVVAATAALLVLALVDRLRGRPARRMIIPAVLIRRQ